MNSFSKPLFENWESLPSLVQLKCIGFMNRDTRTALKVCSWGQKWLVEHCPTRNPGFFAADVKRVNETEFRMFFGFGEKKWNTDKEWKHVGTIEEINEIIQKNLENYDEFDTVKINVEDCPGFKFTTRPNSLQSREVVVALGDPESGAESLRQFDPNCLKVLELYDTFHGSHRMADQLLNLKQVTTTKSFRAGCNFEEVDLMKFEAARLNFNHRQKISAVALNKYIKAKLLKLDELDLRFDLFFPEHPDSLQIILRDFNVHFRGTNFFIDSPFPQYQLKLSRLLVSLKGERVLRKDMNGSEQ